MGFGSCFEGNANTISGTVVRCETEGGGKGAPKVGTHIWSLHTFLGTVALASWIPVPWKEDPALVPLLSIPKNRI